jgi:hypothetical protein
VTQGFIELGWGGKTKTGVFGGSRRQNAIGRIGDDRGEQQELIKRSIMKI